MKIKFILLLTILSCCSILTAQTPSGFNFQGIARNVDGSIVPETALGLRVTIIQGSNDGPVVFVENHTTQTNQYGLFSLEVGNGIGGMSLDSIDWALGPYFIGVEIDFSGGDDYTAMQTAQLLSVPYALHAGSVENSNDADSDPTNEIQTLGIDGGELVLSGGGMESRINLVNLIDTSALAEMDSTDELQTLSKSGSTITLSNGGGSILDEVNDGDTSDSNELQMLELRNGTLSITNGNSVNLDSLAINVDDADADPSNELQLLSLTQQTLSITDGNSVDLSGIGGDDADADPENELQLLELSGNSLSISDGNSVDLDNLDLNVDDGDANPTNEIQLLSLSNNSLSISDGNSVDLGSLISMDEDSDPLNELQDLSADGSILGMTMSDESVDIMDLIANSGSSSISLFGGAIRLYNDPETGGTIDLFDNEGNKKMSLTSGLEPSEGSIELYNAGMFACSLTCSTLFPPIFAKEKSDLERTLYKGEQNTSLVGSAFLKEGEAEIRFSSELGDLIQVNSDYLVTLTPHSADSKGLAAIERTSSGFKVKELFQGKGSYEIDWTIQVIPE